jgi:hypothetical protein
VSCIDPSVRIVTKSPKIGPLIFSISLVYPLTWRTAPSVRFAERAATGSLSERIKSSLNYIFHIIFSELSHEA